MTESNSFWGAMRGCGAALLVLVTLVFVCGVFAVVYYFTTPEGETVAVLPADGRIAASVEAGPGDTLHFTLSYEFPLGGFGMFDGPARDNAIDRALRASSLHVVATSSSGAVLDARCAPYNGRVGVESDIMGTRSLSNALTDCVITIPSGHVQCRGCRDLVPGCARARDARGPQGNAVSLVRRGVLAFLELEAAQRAC
ncbi:MAG: hypothetical protein IPG81_24315 [Sandaracinaceae bacterium]|nr:hypothetical protein [Sandaracinaceae bacterium]